MRILTTGAAGFIGVRVVSLLKTLGHDVVGISLHGSRTDGTRTEAVDLSQINTALHRLSAIDCDVVVHLAAALPSGTDGEAMQIAFDRTVAIDTTMAAFCRARACQLVYASSSSLYGSMNDACAVTEERLPAPANLYAAAKLLGDTMCVQLTEETGAPAAALRISAPYGPRARRATVVDTFVRRALASEDLNVFGSGSRTQDFTFVDDVAEAVVTALEQRASGVFNIGTGAATSMRALAHAAIAAVPESTSRIVAGDADPEEWYRAAMDVSKAQRELGWSARTSLETGLAQLVASLREVA